MLHPALTLESSLTVDEAIHELDRYPEFLHVVVRWALPKGKASWFAMPMHRLRWLLQEASRAETLEAALDLRATPPSPVRRTDAAFELGSFEGVVVDGDQVVAVEAEEIALGAHRGALPSLGERPSRGTLERLDGSALSVEKERAVILREKYLFSYAREDSTFVLEIAQRLRQEGVDLWLDQLDIVGGQRWDRAIENALERCGGMIAVLSPESISSNNVMDEVSYALEGGKRLVPVLLRPCEVPFRLRRVQHIDFTGGYDAAFRRLLKALGDADVAPTASASPPTESVTYAPEHPVTLARERSVTTTPVAASAVRRRRASGGQKVSVLFATDRAASGEQAPAKHFGGGRGPLSFGVAEVSIPRGHRRGELEEPRWWRFEFRPDPRRHVVLLSVTARDRPDFVALARVAVDSSPRREALVFVHGYNVSFENAARRTAQIAYDLKFRGAPMLYSWPSAGGTLRYLEDETNARWTVPHFGEFLSMVQTELGATAIHVIAHSMSNRVLAECLRTYREPLGAAKLRQVVLAAPDIDADTFADLAREFHTHAERVTLYASSRDLALKASKLVHGYPRAGDSEPPLVIADDVDTIDASAVDTNLLGHSYVGDTTSILADVHALLEGGQPPAERRFYLEPREQGTRRYWFFRA